MALAWLSRAVQGRRDALGSIDVFVLTWTLLHVFFTLRDVARACVDAARRLEKRTRASLLSTLRGAGAVTTAASARIGPFSGCVPGAPPEALAVVVNDASDARDPVSVARLASLVVWATARGVSHVSLYDQDGALKRRVGSLRECIVRATVRESGHGAEEGGRGARGRGRGRGPAPPACVYRVRVAETDGAMATRERFSCGGKATTTTTTTTVEKTNRRGGGAGDGGGERGPSREDEPPSRQTTVDVLEAGDGAAAWLDAVDRRRDAIAAADASVGSDASSSRPPPHTVESLERHARDTNRHLPNVDLLIVFGEHFHLAGYPAWQTWKTEIYRERSARGFTRERFESLLRRYANTARRFGR
ncbi:uncharacterized protein MICPUCDRAFT_38333 [Micromonas pusilla CCMP1545]|jgi:hypothetical protein|uniref:ditrans,polycis-polyprenyl diphosphate synthase [(2E,6E)-farnesyldiphosphate specific] n=2 Tax=Micromonas pusilla TaxID=38833 RepID=C1MJN2_MICPC|nr:uncharacterized protein MICPUCDRAFT_38333 [Micromonas pusilla CCMP1545]EEH59225.1 predicted protein [Micromonas pusilla CCMP1545]|eukprot:XP_003055849.1 predicted protein [Micromonas pusilla CCMP1545]